MKSANEITLRALFRQQRGKLAEVVYDGGKVGQIPFVGRQGQILEIRIREIRAEERSEA